NVFVEEALGLPEGVFTLAVYTGGLPQSPDFPPLGRIRWPSGGKSEKGRVANARCRRPTGLSTRQAGGINGPTPPRRRRVL
ncbi:MAG TPA: hypothetical protein VF278_15125, partial [Pirellulales bacterium]